MPDHPFFDPMPADPAPDNFQDAMAADHEQDLKERARERWVEMDFDLRVVAQAEHKEECDEPCDVEA